MYGRTQADWVIDTVNDNCANKKLYVVDAVYYLANTQLCQATCPCFANSSDFESLNISTETKASLVADLKTGIDVTDVVDAMTRDSAELFAAASAFMNATNFNLSKNF
jgi:hypothetical protein